jgi:hypothetical protein
MLMKPDKNKLVDMLIKGGVAKQKPVDAAGDEIDDSTAFVSMAEELIAAIEGKNPKVVADVIKSMYETCNIPVSPDTETPPETPAVTETK